LLFGGYLTLAVKLVVPLLLALPGLLIGGSTPSSIALSSSPNPSVLGRPVNFTAVVAPPTATGNVTFYDGTTVLGTAALTGGQATFSTIFLPSGHRSLDAYYGGDANYAASTSVKVAQTVNAVPGGGFQAAVDYGTGAAYQSSVAVGDFNGDGKADLAVDSGGGNVSVLLGNGDGTFQAAADTRTNSGSIAVGDFNGDGKADIAVDGDFTWRPHAGFWSFRGNGGVARRA
jgi:hypothetical protein